MDLHHMKAAIDSMAASDLSEMEVSHEGWTLRLVRHATTGAAPASVKPLAPASTSVRALFKDSKILTGEEIKCLD